MLHNLNNYHIILGSASPRRKQLLEGLGIKFKVLKKDTDESFPPMEHADVAMYLANKKNEAFKDELNDHTLIITADTIVSINGKILNKPADNNEALNMLTELAGNKHTVYTGVCIQTKFKKTLFYSATDVYFNSLSRAELVYYIDTCKPFDKAGAYGVQEWMGYAGIEKIEGCFFNVMGLPLSKVYNELKKF
jgi:septum formation protein